jgi:hypothetical protein
LSKHRQSIPGFAPIALAKALPSLLRRTQRFPATIGLWMRPGRGYRYPVPAAIFSEPFQKKRE